MSVTAWGASVMMATALGVAELPTWLPGAQYISPTPPANTIIIVPAKACPPGFEVQGSRCLPDCVRGPCRRVRLAEEQTTIYGPDGRVQGRAVPQGDGSVRYYDAQGRSVGTSTTTGTGTSTGTTFYGPSGNVTGRSSGPAPAQPAFPGQRR
jgi:hypothetical protein